MCPIQFQTDMIIFDFPDGIVFIKLQWFEHQSWKEESKNCLSCNQRNSYSE
jgi:hypothetical protein